MSVDCPPQLMPLAGIGAHGCRLWTAYGVADPGLYPCLGPEFARDNLSAIHDRDHAAFLSVLVGRLDLDIYEFMRALVSRHKCSAAEATMNAGQL